MADSTPAGTDAAGSHAAGTQAAEPQGAGVQQAGWQQQGAQQQVITQQRRARPCPRLNSPSRHRPAKAESAATSNVAARHTSITPNRRFIFTVLPFGKQGLVNEMPTGSLPKFPVPCNWPDRNFQRSGASQGSTPTFAIARSEQCQRRQKPHKRPFYQPFRVVCIARKSPATLASEPDFRHIGSLGGQ
jgi:hypothetical protein